MDHIRPGILIILAFSFSISVQAKSKFVMRKAIHTPDRSCDKAYKEAKGSPSTGVVVEATDTCEKATNAACVNFVAKNSDGPDTGDGRLLAASCDLSMAYGADKGVSKLVASPKCEKAYRAGSKSPSVAEVRAAADACQSEMEAACQKMVDENSDGANTGDGRLISAACSLAAAHGAYVEVTRRPAPATVDPGAPAPGSAQ